MSYEANYSWAHNIGDAQGDAPTAFQGETRYGLADLNRFDISANRGNVVGTRRQRLLVTGTYELPFGKGRQWLNSFDSAIQVTALEDASQVLISVHNEGPVIPIEDRSRIFERFYRSRDASYRAPGTGLSLSIVQKIAEAHKGQVWVTSAREKGTTFFFLFPESSGGNFEQIIY